MIAATDVIVFEKTYEKAVDPGGVDNARASAGAEDSRFLGAAERRSHCLARFSTWRDKATDYTTEPV